MFANHNSVCGQKFLVTGRNFYRRLNKNLTATQWFLLLYLVGTGSLLIVVFLLKLAMKFI
ncbi:MAG TPA: hypothetical protein DF774_02680 [Rheinheimera sp.]|uniref:hypothetical protein n=1 Tax=Rheinheimera sp. TaxID=1869214 RepID=UPI000ED6578A|nr:hypothetical protein [Rheinheimera sp.]HCU64647.1 hypothetical protein [Rheinheimera sp.]